MSGFYLRDISHEVFGKYQHCTMHDGLWYAESDFSCGKPRKGALPSPRQDTPEKIEIAAKMHKAAATVVYEKNMPKAKPARVPSLWGKVVGLFS